MVGGGTNIYECRPHSTSARPPRGCRWQEQLRFAEKRTKRRAPPAPAAVPSHAKHSRRQNSAPYAAFLPDHPDIGRMIALETRYEVTTHVPSSTLAARS